MLRRTLQQHDANSERASGGDLAVGRIPAAVFRDHHVDTTRQQQLTIFRFAERAAGEYVACMRYIERRVDRIHRSHNIVMLRLTRERGDLLPTHCEKHSLRLGAQCLCCSFSIDHVSPSIARHGLPGRPTQRQQWRIGLPGRLDGVRRDRIRKGMRGIDQGVDAIVTQICGESRCSAKAATSCGHGLCERRCRATGERQPHAQVVASGEAGRELSRFGRTAENQ